MRYTSRKSMIPDRRWREFRRDAFLLHYFYIFSVAVLGGWMLVLEGALPN